MGMSLPLLFNFLKDQRLHFSKVVGRIYAINTFASTLGVAIGGYLLFYFFRTDEIFKLNLLLIGLTIPLVGTYLLNKKALKVFSYLMSIVALIILFKRNVIFKTS